MRWIDKGLLPSRGFRTTARQRRKKTITLMVLAVFWDGGKRLKSFSS